MRQSPLLITCKPQLSNSWQPIQSLSLEPARLTATLVLWDKDNALFLKVFSGELLTSFKRQCVFGEMTQRSISSGRSAQFPVFGRLTADYSVPGAFIQGQGDMAQNEVVIRIDDYLTAATDIYDLDQAKAHYDYRSIVSTELGEALARAYDKRIARLIAIGARTSTGDLTADLPSGLSPDDPFRTGTQVDLAKATPTSDDLVASVFAAAEALDKKDISSENRVPVQMPLRPTIPRSKAHAL